MRYVRQNSINRRVSGMWRQINKTLINLKIWHTLVLAAAVNVIVMAILMM